VRALIGRARERLVFQMLARRKAADPLSYIGGSSTQGKEKKEIESTGERGPSSP